MKDGEEPEFVEGITHACLAGAHSECDRQNDDAALNCPCPHHQGQKTKKDFILGLYEQGVTDVAVIAGQAGARPSYVAQVLQRAGHLEGGFDLYTTTGSEQNVYTRYFRNVLAFRNIEAARESVQRIDRLYNYFERLGDRAGQHQAMVLAMTGRNRAKWSGKMDEGEVFAEWLRSHL